MEIKGQESQMGTLTESEILSLVAAKLKDRVLFPKKVEEAKKYINSIVSSSL